MVGDFYYTIYTLCLHSKDLRKPDDLITTFHLNPLVFPKKFERAISGSGQEYRRIRTLHSSSLISLLCFYSISEENPLTLRIENHDVKFTDSIFEEKNTIAEDNNGEKHESNMDVVLFGEDVNTGKRVVFYLESKFSEYLSWGKYRKISSRVYEKIYDDLYNGKYLERMGLKFEDTPGIPGYFDLMAIKGRTHHYAGGFKQMISHFLGVKNIAESGKYSDCDIYLGEILFRFNETIDPKEKKLKDYFGLYEVLAEGLNSLSESKFKVVGHCLTYQDVFRNFNLDESVHYFYSL